MHDLQTILDRTYSFAKDGRAEYITPEHLLYVLISEPLFARSFSNCGGNTDMLKKDIASYIYNEEFVVPNLTLYEIKYSCEFKEMLDIANEKAQNSGHDEANIIHLLSAIFDLKDSYARYYIEKQGIMLVDLLFEMCHYDEDEVDEKQGYGEVDLDEDDSCVEYIDFDGDEEGFREIFDVTNPYVNEDLIEKYLLDNRLFKNESFDEEEIEETDYEKNSNTKKKKSILDKYVCCMNDISDDKNPLIGREKEVERTIQILCRKEKNNPLHIGEAVVGKTAITYGIVQMINEGNVPECLQNSKIYMIDVADLLEGTVYRGDFEKRFKKIMEAIKKEDNPIVYFDEIHNIVGAGAVNGGSIDAANMLKKYLTDGKIRFIGATTYQEYNKYFLKDKGLVRRFQTVDIKEPTVEETIQICKGLKRRYEKFHNVVYKSGVIEYAVNLSNRYINERYLPDKAIDLIDEAGAYKRIHKTATKKQYVDKKLIDSVLSNICNIPEKNIDKAEEKSIFNLDKVIFGKIFGQDEAIREVVNSIMFAKAGLNDENKPLCSLLFVGPTGVGKTEVCKVLSEELNVDLIRFDMSEYSEKHTVSKLIGSPAGYVGYEEGGLLTDEVRKHPYAVLLLDEIEKAHADIYNVLLSVMDYATLTDNQGRKADFRNIILVMTSNTGADKVGKELVGFGNRTVTSEIIMEKVKDNFSPEFRNRLNKIVVFNDINEESGKNIVNKKLTELVTKLKKKNIDLTISSNIADYVYLKGISKEYGARQIERVINNDIKPILAKEILFGSLKKGGKCLLDICNDEVIVKKD